jgi:hypothetical protein
MVTIKGNIARVTKNYKRTKSEIEVLKLMNNTLDYITISIYKELNFKNKNKVYQIISRLRSKGIEIENRKGIGYKVKGIKWIK